jgi:hypothetical protein
LPSESDPVNAVLVTLVDKMLEIISVPRKYENLGSTGKKSSTHFVTAVLCFEAEMPIKTAEKTKIAMSIIQWRVV